MSDRSDKNEYDIDPDTGIPKRISAAERRKRLAESSKKNSGKRNAGKRAAPRKSSNKSVERADVAQGKNARLVDKEEELGSSFKVFFGDLPGGGQIALTSPGEIDFFNKMKDRYIDAYAFTQPNDLTRLAQLLVCELEANRMMQRLSGHIPTFDDNGDLIGLRTVSEEERSTILDQLPKLQVEIRKIESALKLDKKTREGDGGGDIRAYMESLKKAAIQHGVHLSERYVAYDNFVNEVRWRMRVLRDADKEDRKYHDVENPDALVKWMEAELEKLEEVDKEFANNKQSLWVAKGIP